MKPCNPHSVPEGSHFCARCAMHVDAIKDETYEKRIAELEALVASFDAVDKARIAETVALKDELSRAREALIATWTVTDLDTPPEAKYNREIAKEQG